MSATLLLVPSERSCAARHNLNGMLDAMVQVPQCPNCSREMVLSHKFYAQPSGPQMWHFPCTACKVGLTVAENKDDPTPSQLS